MHCRMFSGIPGCYLPDASSTSTLTLCQPEMSPNIAKYLLGSNCFLSPTENQSDLKKNKKQKNYDFAISALLYNFFPKPFENKLQIYWGFTPIYFKIFNCIYLFIFM